MRHRSEFPVQRLCKVLGVSPSGYFAWKDRPACKGNCFDDAMVETFFKTLKAELVWRTVFHGRAEAIAAIARYIDGFYNPVRRHSALDFISPLQFESKAA